MIALALTIQDAPRAVSMSFQRKYAERYDWLAQQFKDLAFSFYSNFLYYNDYDDLDEMTRGLYRQGVVPQMVVGHDRVALVPLNAEY